MAAPSLDEETTKKVIRQVEFYFSDSNLPRDTFLRNTINESEDKMVSVALICSFSRMRGHLGLGDVKADGVPADTVQAVANTLRTSDFLKISEDGLKVGRKTELAKPEEVIEQLDHRTIAASPLPYDAKLEDVEAFFAKFAKVSSVRLPRHVANKNLLCGTALVEFSAEEDAEKVLKETLSYAGVDLELKPKKDFDAEREKQEKEYENSGGKANQKGSEEVYYPKGLIVAFTLKRKSSGDDSKQNGKHEPVSEVEASKANEGESVADKNGTEKMEECKEGGPHETPVMEGNDVKDGDKSSEGGDKNDGEKAALEEKSTTDAKDKKDVISREDLRPLFEKFGTVKFIDFSIGEESGFIRFEEPEAGQKARAAAVLTDEGGLTVKNYIALLEPVTGDAEKEYWSHLQEGQAKFKNGRGRGGKFHRGGRGRPRDNGSHAGRPNKAQKVAA